MLKSARFHAVARVFAVLLLCWTTADLCCGVCVHDREPLAAGGGGAVAVGQPSATDAGHFPLASDDCFCCSHFVHPQVRYQVTPAHTLVSAIEAETVLRPQFPASQLYHPPLADA